MTDTLLRVGDQQESESESRLFIAIDYASQRIELIDFSSRSLAEITSKLRDEHRKVLEGFVSRSFSELSRSTPFSLLWRFFVRKAWLAALQSHPVIETLQSTVHLHAFEDVLDEVRERMP